MNNPLLAAVLIIKNEEANLAACLDSLAALRPLLGEIIVYDTGSTDSSVEIAKSYGARVTEGYWDDDFARARNDAARLSNAKWVLSIDADERLVADAPRLRRLLRQGLTENFTGWDVINVTILDVDAKGTSLARHPFCKLFRPLRARWTSPIHEILVSTRPERELVIAEGPESVIHLRHHGYAQADRRKEKAHRNASVADAGLGGESGAALSATSRAKLLFDQGRALAAAGDLVTAESRYRAALGLPDVDAAMEVAILQDAVSFFLIRKNLDEAARLLDRLETQAGDRDVVAWLRANLLIDAGKPGEAIPLLRELRAVRLSATLELDGSVAVATLMRAAISAGEFDEALACAIQLVGSTGDVERYGHQMMRLWGNQPPHLLAALLSDVIGPRRKVVAAALAGLPDPAPAVGAELLTGATVSGHSSGASFRR